jgi:hypothetical protein
MSKRGLRAGLLVTAVTAVAGCIALGSAGAQPTHAAGTRPQVPAAVVIEGYGLQATPQAALTFPGNELIFEAEVVRAGAPRSVTPKAAQGRLTYTYRPIEVRVQAVHKGSAVRSGQRVPLRALGGTDQAGGKTVYADAVPESTWRAGTRLYVLGQNPVDAGDGLTAVTPNFVFVAGGGRLLDPHGEQPPTGLADFRAALVKRWGSPR